MDKLNWGSTIRDGMIEGFGINIIEDFESTAWNHEDTIFGDMRNRKKEYDRYYIQQINNNEKEYQFALKPQFELSEEETFKLVNATEEEIKDFKTGFSAHVTYCTDVAFEILYNRYGLKFDIHKMVHNIFFDGINFNSLNIESYRRE